uniref:Annexin n=1 Tax=Angiostrongylus cantonensis TaxID=6313 RepID=A0A0K0DNZ9_ANGCA
MVNTVASNDTQGELFIALHTIKQYESRVQIWAAQAIVLNPDKTKEELVEVILGTAADRSFIANDLAKTLQLKDGYSTELANHKFGDSKADTKKYGITSIIL